MTFSSSGDLGIGASTPYADLQIGQGTSGSNLLISGANSDIYGSELFFGDNGGSNLHQAGMSITYNSGANSLNFWDNHGGSGVIHSNNRMTIMRDVDRVGINNPSPSYGLDVNGTGRFTNTLIVGTPTASSHATTKSYVDSLITGSTYWSASGNDIYNANSGNVGIGTNSPSHKFVVDETRDLNDSDLTTFKVIQDKNSSNNFSRTAIHGYATKGGWSNVGMYGVVGEAEWTSTRGNKEVVGVKGIARSIEDNTYSLTASGSLKGILSETYAQYVTGQGPIDSVYGVHVQGLQVDASTNVNNWYGLRIDSTSGSITNKYGIYQEESSADNYFAGNIGIGTSSPSSLSHLYDGSIPDATTDLLTLQGYSGDVSTTPEAIAIKFHTSDSNSNAYSSIRHAVVNDTDYGDNDEGASNLIFNTTNNGSSSDKMIITGRGDIGINAINPQSKLDVDGLIKMRNYTITEPEDVVNKSYLDSVVDGINNSLGDAKSLYIRGVGSNNPGSRVLKIGDTTIYSGGGRGLRLTVLSKSDFSIVSDTIYDTYGSTASSDSLATALNGINNTQIGILVSYDAWENSVTTNLDNAFLRLGLSKAMGTENSGSRRPYAAIFEGASNSEDVAKAVEVSLENTAYQPYAEIRGYLSDGSFLATGSKPNALFRPQGDDLGLIVDYSGNVGIGTAMPGTELDVYGNTSSDIYYDGYDANYYLDPAANIMSHSAILAGNVGIGTTNPLSRLHIYNGRALIQSNATPLEIKPVSDSGLATTLMYRSASNGTANYFMVNGADTYFATYDSGEPNDASGMIRLTPNTSSDAPVMSIGDSGSASGARLDIGGNIRLQNSGNSYFNGGNVGIGTSNPSAKLDVSGNINITEAESYFSLYRYKYFGGIQSNGDIGGGGSYYTYMGNGARHSAGYDWKDFYVQNHYVDPTALVLGQYGEMYVLGKNVSASGYYTLEPKFTINSSGHVGVGTFSPSAGLDVQTGSTYSIYAGNKRIGNVAEPVNNSDAVTKNYVDSVLTNPTISGDLNMGGNDILGVNKLTVNTIDPLYEIDNVLYSSYAASVVGGVKEEYIGKTKINSYNSGKGEYEKVINFKKQKVGTDLWLWYKTVDFNKDNVDVFVTPYGSLANVYYEIKDNSIILRSDKSVDVSYRLIGKRFDWRSWPTKAKDQNQSPGLKID
jgi:hypothetical protein